MSYPTMLKPLSTIRCYGRGAGVLAEFYMYAVGKVQEVFIFGGDASLNAASAIGVESVLRKLTAHLTSGDTRFKRWGGQTQNATSNGLTL